MFTVFFSSRRGSLVFQPNHARLQEQLGMGGGDRDVIQYPTDVTAAMVPWAVDVLPEELNDELALSGVCLLNSLLV